MILDRLTRNHIREIKVGETAYFTLPTEKAMESARVQVAQLKRLEGIQLERVETEERLTIGYKRIL